jgi:hypothetical protein
MELWLPQVTGKEVRVGTDRGFLEPPSGVAAGDVEFGIFS